MSPKKNIAIKKRRIAKPAARKSPADSPTTSRKQTHVELVVKESVTFRKVTSGFEAYRFEHNALPEISYEETSIKTRFLGKDLGAPLVISSMTGGYADALAINRSLAVIAEEYRLAMGVGSARQALESTKFHETYRTVRKTAPNAFIFTNIGGAEIGSYARAGTISEFRRIIDLVEANALAVHLNPLQELMQPEGVRDFRDVLKGIEVAVATLGVPIIVKEVGAGISREVAERLIAVGVEAIDVAGAGGTSWAGVEILRNAKALQPTLEPFWDWGIPTAEAILSIAPLKNEHPFVLIASGGITSGVEIAKSIALGCDLAAIARPILKALLDSGEEGLRTFVERILFQLRGVMFLTGAKTLDDLGTKPLSRSV